MGVVILALAGCCHQAPPAGYYDGPTLPMAEVVGRINVNNQAIRTLWAQQSFTANFVDDKGHSHFVSGDGVLLLVKPRTMLFNAGDITGSIFEVGSNDDDYWVTLMPQNPTQWWGRWANLGKPCAKRLPFPIQPDMMLDILGVSDVDTQLSREPVPIMRFDNDADAYIFVWSEAGMDRWIARREIWYDRVTFLPRRVLLYDDDGRVAVRADLDEFQAVPGPPGPQGKIATSFKLSFPDAKSRLEFHLSSVEAQHKGTPRAGSIPRRTPDDVKVIQLDEDCGD